MRVIILGSGKMGHASALDLEKDNKVERITLTDTSEDNLERALGKAKTKKIDIVQADATDSSAIDLMKEYDVGIGALPHPASAPALSNAIKAGLSVVDMVYEPKQWELDEAAKKAGITIIPGLGVHPGIANVFAGHAYNQLDETHKIILRCGGLPQDPSGSPLLHKTAFNLNSALGEYAKEVKIIEDGKLKVVDPLSEPEKLHHPKLGDLECFLTNTTSTLIKTLRNVKELKSKTVRWPGNLDRVRILFDCGLLSLAAVEIGGVRMRPIDVFASIVRPKMTMEEGGKELTYLAVEAEGIQGGVLKRYEYELLDYYDEKEGLTSMARTTGFPPTIAARMIVNGQITQTGVVPPEKVFIGEHFEFLMKELAQRGISIKLSESTIRTA